MSTVLSQGAPLRTRVDRRLPALSSLRGQSPAHEIRWPLVGKRPHVEADLADDAAGGERANPPGMVVSCWAAIQEEFEASLDLLVDPADGFIDGVWDLLEVEGEQEAMMLGHSPAQGIA